MAATDTLTARLLRTRDGSRPPWVERPSAATRIAKFVILALVVIVILFPFLTVISTSLAPASEINANGGYVVFTSHPTLNAYRTVFGGDVVTRSVLVSVFVTLVGTFLSLAVTIGMAYGLSRPGVWASKPMLFLALGTFLFSPGIIPNYLVVKQLGLLNSYWSLILPVLLNAFNMVVVRAFFMNIPRELIEAARIDGAGDWTVLRRIMLPLSKSVIAVVGLFYAVGYWNSFFTALLYLTDSSKWPLQLILRTYVTQSQGLATDRVDIANLPPSQSIQMAVVVVAVVPIACVYPFLQRFFTRGVLTGAIKG